MSDEQIAQFQSITGLQDAEQAKFYLGSANNDVSSAIALYFEEHKSAASPAADAPSRKRAAPSGGVATFGSLSQGDEDEDVQNLYTGGKASGMVVQGPKKTDDTTDAIFKKARDAGPPPADAGASSAPAKPKFGGGGYTLGDYEKESEAVVEDTAGQQPERVTKELVFYKQGFTVDGGPLRRFDDPANQEFLDDVNKGYVPREFGRVQVGINLVDKRGEDYKEPPKPKYTAFGGGGMRLGDAPTPAGGSTTTTTTTSTGAAAGSSEPAIDSSKPTTSLQIRLADGTRIKAKFNLDSTVGDIRSFIQSSRPDGPPAFDLQTRARGPPTTLGDDSETIEAAGLANSVVIQAKR